MAENDTPKEEDKVSAEDWAAAMQQQQAPAGEGGAANPEDEWAAALAEQAQHDAEMARVAQELKQASDPYQAKPAKDLFPEFGAGGSESDKLNDFKMILDIPVRVTVELGRTKLAIRDVLQLAHGSVIELEGLAGEPMDVLVNGTLIAQGEVVVVNEKFGIRLTDIITPAERMRKLRQEG